jgi:hypothetical protein
MFLAVLADVSQPSTAALMQNEALIKSLAPPMTAVARLIVAERWDPRFEELVQRAPSAAPLGSKWTSTLPAWQKARAAVGARMTRILDAYSQSAELPALLAAELKDLYPGAEAAALTAVLNGPGGPGILWSQASTTFIVEVMSENPNGPSPAERAFAEQIGVLNKRFRERIGPALPPAGPDPGRQPEVVKFMGEPAGSTFHRLWMVVVGKAVVAMNGAINLMIFDDREAILRDIAQAVATVK